MQELCFAGGRGPTTSSERLIGRRPEARSTHIANAQLAVANDSSDAWLPARRACGCQCSRLAPTPVGPQPRPWPSPSGLSVRPAASGATAAPRAILPNFEVGASKLEVRGALLPPARPWLVPPTAMGSGLNPVRQIDCQPNLKSERLSGDLSAWRRRSSCGGLSSSSAPPPKAAISACCAGRTPRTWPAASCCRSPPPQ